MKIRYPLIDGNSTSTFSGETLGPDTFTLSVTTGRNIFVPGVGSLFQQLTFISLINKTFTNSRESDAINNDYTQNYAGSAGARALI